MNWEWYQWMMLWKYFPLFLFNQPITHLPLSCHHPEQSRIKISNFISVSQSVRQLGGETSPTPAVLVWCLVRLLLILLIKMIPLQLIKWNIRPGSTRNSPGSDWVRRLTHQIFCQPNSGQLEKLIINIIYIQYLLPNTTNHDTRTWLTSGFISVNNQTHIYQ